MVHLNKSRVLDLYQEVKQNIAISYKDKFKKIKIKRNY